MRIDAVNKIPDLLEKLIKEAQTTAKRIKQKNEDAKQITKTIKATASLLSAAEKQKAQ
jgi:hypothetical protein